jgi:hypothetical protein
MRYLLVLLVALSACSAKLDSDMTIDGAKLEPTSCRSGAVFGFRGVELTGKSGVRLRLAATETGEANLVVIPAGAAVGHELGHCGSFELADQNSTINDVKNVKGKATLDCTTEGTTVKGRVSFANCH